MITTLEYIRRKNNLTQNGLAEAAHLCRTQVSALENRKVWPWPAARKRLSKALGMPEERLFKADGWPLEVEINERYCG